MNAQPQEQALPLPACCAALRGLLPRLPGAALVVDAQRRVLLCNEFARSLLALPADVDGQVLQLPDIAGLTHADGPLARALRGEAGRQQRAILLPGRSQETLADIDAQALRDDANGIVAVLMLIDDAGGREASAAELREANRGLRAMIANNPGMMFRCDVADGWHMRFMSDAAEKLSGYPASHFIEGRVPWQSLILPEDLDAIAAQFAQGGRTDALSRSQYRLRHRDGHIVWCESHARIVDSRWYEGVVFDISEHKRVQEALAKSEARLRLMSDAAPQTMWAADADGSIEFVNQAGLKYFGRSQEELAGAGWLSSVHPDDMAVTVERWSASLLNGEPVDLQYRVRRFDGEYRWNIARAVAETDAQGKPARWFGVTTDVEDLKRAQQAAEQATRMKSAFLSSMSHEIRTPMNAIIGMTSILLDSSLSNEQRDSAEIIRSSGEHLLTLINDILDYSKIEAGAMQLEHSAFSLSDCVESAIDLVAGAAQSNGVEIGYLAAPGLVEGLLGDVGRLRQVLVNLLSNAVKFTPRGGQVSVDVRSAAVAGEDGVHDIHIDVRDTGIGIAAEVLPRLFDSFTQADASTTRRYGGTGLGLSICKALVELMGGRIGVSSEPGRGSVFGFGIRATAVSLPRRRADEPPPQLDGLRVLIVDDIEINRRILLHYTSLWRMRPRAAASAAEALEWLGSGEAFDLALLDFHMPDVDGLQLARQLRSLRSEQDLPILILSSAASEAREPGVVSGAVNKPIKPSRLLDELRNLYQRIRRPTLRSTGFSLPRELGREHPLRILVAEDNAVNQKVAQLLFTRLGYSPDFAGDGEEALAAIERQVYDVVFMDVQMPRLDGLDATREICRRHAPGTRPRIVAMTANATVDDRQACAAAGMDDYLSKPVIADRVVEALKKCRRRTQSD